MCRSRSKSRWPSFLLSDSNWFKFTVVYCAISTVAWWVSVLSSSIMQWQRAECQEFMITGPWQKNKLVGLVEPYTKASKAQEVLNHSWYLAKFPSSNTISLQRHPPRLPLMSLTMTLSITQPLIGTVTQVLKAAGHHFLSCSWYSM